MNLNECYETLVGYGYDYDRLKSLLDKSIEIEVDGERRKFAIKVYNQSFSNLCDSDEYNNYIISFNLLTRMYDGGIIDIVNNTDIVNYGYCTEEYMYLLDIVCLSSFFDALENGITEFSMLLETDIVNKDIDICMVKKFLNTIG